MKTKLLIYTASIIILSVTTATGGRFSRKNSKTPRSFASRSDSTSSSRSSSRLSKGAKSYFLPSRSTSRSRSNSGITKLSSQARKSSGSSMRIQKTPSRSTTYSKPTVLRKPSTTRSSRASRHSSSGSSRTYTPSTRSAGRSSIKLPRKISRKPRPRRSIRPSGGSTRNSVKSPTTRSGSPSRSFSKPVSTTRIKRPITKLPGRRLGKIFTSRPSSRLKSKKPDRRAKKPSRSSTTRNGSQRYTIFHNRPRPTDTLHRQSPLHQTNRQRADSRNHKLGRNNSPAYYKPYHSDRNNRHHRHRPTHYRRPRYHHNRWSCPIRRRPFIYSAGFGFTWWKDNFAISFSSYRPVDYNGSTPTPYYNNWHRGSYGYSSFYYGGWRHGWYGGISYVYNPWPIYRTYYIYEPKPVVIEQPVIIRKDVIVEQKIASVIETTTELQAAPISYTAGYPDDYVVVEERTTIRPGSNGGTAEYNATEFDPAYIYEDRFDPFYYDEDFLNEALQIGFSSYASTLNPESIWISYAQFDTMY